MGIPLPVTAADNLSNSRPPGRMSSRPGGMLLALQAQDLADERNGVGAELLALGIPSVLVPYPHARDDHQTANAAYVVEGGAGITYTQDAFTPSEVTAVVRSLVYDAPLWERRARSARGLGRPQAAREVAELLLGGVAAEVRGGER